MTSPIVSVLIAAYNAREYIADAIESVLAQTFSEFEIIIVDDASSDGTADIVAPYLAMGRDIYFLRQPRNMGPSAARNAALARARGAWMAVLDADDLWEPTRLSRLVTTATASACDVVCDNQRMISMAGGRRLGESYPDIENLHEIDTEYFIENDLRKTRNISLGYVKPLVSMALLRKEGVRYNENFNVGEDYFFLLDLLLRGARMVFVAEPLYIYRRHESSLTISGGRTGENFRRLHDNLAAYLAANAGRLPPRVAALLRARLAFFDYKYSLSCVLVALKSGRIDWRRIMRRPRILADVLGIATRKVLARS